MAKPPTRITDHVAMIILRSVDMIQLMLRITILPWAVV
jgi:hypothetical protein